MRLSLENLDECGRPMPGTEFNRTLSLDGVAECRGKQFRFAYPVGVDQNSASRYSFIDESDVRDELWDVQPGDHVVDLGSSFGSYTLGALACGAASAICLNPNDFEQDLLLASLKLNGWESRVVQVRKGIWSRSGYLSDEDQGFRETLPDGAADFKIGRTADGKYTQLFPVHTLDSLALSPLAGERVIMKVDLEGAEAEIFKGAASFMSRFAPAFILVEKHRFKGPHIAEACIRDLDALGYGLKSDRLFCTHQISHAVFVPKESL